MAGLIVTQVELNASVGDICRGIIYQLRRAINFKHFADRFTAQDLVDEFGISLEDANLIKSAVTELDAINTAFQSNRAFIDQLSGLGDL